MDASVVTMGVGALLNSGHLGVRPTFGVKMTNVRHEHRTERASNACNMVTVHDRCGRVRYLTPSARQVFGVIDEAELLGRDPLTFVHPDDRAALQRAFVLWLADRSTGEPIRYRVQRSDGAWTEIESVGSRHDSVSGGGSVVVTSRESQCVIGRVLVDGWV
jgi:PAS domain S-box-containing protein